MAPASTLGYWEAVRRLEASIEQRGHVVYDGHIAHCPEKVRAEKWRLEWCHDVTMSL
jgi:hypothetical protein